MTISETSTVTGPLRVLGHMGITGVYYNILDVSPGQVRATRTQTININYTCTATVHLYSDIQVGVALIRLYFQEN